MMQATNYTLRDLLDIPKLQALLDTLDEIHSMPSAIIDAGGNILTATAWQDICLNFHRRNPETEEICKKSDSYIVNELDKNPPHVIYNCPFGLVDTATPIIVEGRHLGNVFTGQLFTQPPDEERFIAQARQYGFDEKDYLAAFRKVPVISEERLKKNLTFLGRFTEMLAAQGLLHLRQVETARVLGEREKTFSTTLHSIGDGVIATDIEGRVTLMNAVAERLTGWPLAAARDRALSEVFHIVQAMTRKPVENPVTRVLESGAIVGLANHTVLISREGTEYQIADSAAPIRDNDGRVSGVILVFSDVTENYKADEALRKSERYLRETQLVAGLGTYEMDFATGAWTSSAILNDIFGIDEFFVRSVEGWASLIHPDDRPMMVDHFTNEVVGRRQRFDREYRVIRHNDKAVRWLHGLGRLELNEQNQPVRMIGTIQDITGKKTADIALIAAEQKFRNLLESVHLVAVILNMDGSLVFCNDYFLKLTGWLREDVINKNWFDLFVPEKVRGAVRHIFETAITTKTLPLHYENAILSRDKNQKLIVWDNSLLRNADGDLIGVASIGTDITEHRKLEAQLRQAQKMESIGHLAGGIAHDFNNILSVIIGYGHVALMNMAPDDHQRADIEQMLEAGDRAAQLTKDLLLFSRKQVSEQSNINLNNIIRKVEKFLKRIIGEDVDCETSLSEKVLQVRGDAHQLEQVLMNLATNSRDAMPSGGVFTVATAQATLDETFFSAHGYGKSGSYAMITISDTGKGMDAATKDRIFEPFFTTKEVGKGTGLGLAVVYGIIKQHEGYINVYSEPGSGTTFKIYLPLIRTDAPEHKREAEGRPTGGTETILLAEDDESVRNLMRSVLERFGYRVITAQDGQEAVNKYREHKDTIRLLLFDIIMPKKTGKEAYEEIKTIQPDIKIVFQSGYAPDAVRKKVLLDEKATVLCKPVSPIEILKVVRLTLDA